MKKQLIALSTASFALAAVLVNAAPVLAEGVLAASSGATVDAGFPVITGPGTNVYTPTGGYITDPLPKMRVPDAVVERPVPKVQVKNYSWTNPDTQVARGAGTKTTRRIVQGSYNTIITN